MGCLLLLVVLELDVQAVLDAHLHLDRAVLRRRLLAWAHSSGGASERQRTPNRIPAPAWPHSRLTSSAR